MAILNVTPDSFSDGGKLYRNQHLDLDLVLRRVEALLQQGAAIIDVGGESTRPGAEVVSSQQEMDRVLPVVEAIAKHFDTIISVDTSNPELMALAANAGAGLLNDVRALQREGALQAAAKTGLPICLMHMQGEPQTMQQAPEYHNVVNTVQDFLSERVQACEHAGIAKKRLVLDPGFGFGKTVQHNLELIQGLSALQALECPLLVGLSRKRLIGAITGAELNERMPGSIVLALECVLRGATILRVHDVKAHADMLALHAAVNNSAAYLEAKS